ncbi:MAG: glycosyltransferase [Candidatus Curtissbacteria bacterium]|nr:glycosyltransferase [Candidatus Curtissbacteria bacterium]
MSNKLWLEIVVPVFNEEKVLAKNINTLTSYCKENFSKKNYQIIIADNGSYDATAKIGQKLAKSLNIKYLRIAKKGRGGALVDCWSKSKSEIISYMDVDLSSNLNYFPKLISAVEKGADLAIGSRLVTGSKVKGRTFLREAMSRTYNTVVRLAFFVSFHDAQCGFKVLKRNVFMKILPVIKNRNWFFDSELLIIAEKAGFKLKEIPIVWHDNPSSTVKVAKTATEDLNGLVKLFIKRPWQLLK